MGWFFNRKKEQEKNDSIPVICPTIAHQHTWKDMPWYIRTYWNGAEKTGESIIYEPYVCITCGERKNVELEHNKYINVDAETRERYFAETREKYKDYLVPQAIVEDMINNIVLVKDVSHLRMMEEKLGTPHRDVGTSATDANLVKPAQRIAPTITMPKPQYQVKLKDGIK